LSTSNSNKRLNPFEPEAMPVDTKGRLVRAAIEQIEARGLAQVTVRTVAAAAGANVAAVSYHFQSMEALIAAALEGSIRHMVADSEAYLARMEHEPAPALAELLAYYLEGALRYPRITKALLHDAFSADDYRGPFPVLFGPVMQRLAAALRRAVPGLDARAAARRVVAALSATFFPAFFSGLFAPLGALESAADRVAYSGELAKQALAPLMRRRPRTPRMG
jgi:TetR/AcrR family transcriptional regulator, regulator of cefoperazone and chloramphenicol sensitivity